jgi:hypothetical protein
MDNFCIDLGTLLDNPSVKTLEGPGQHTVHWYVPRRSAPHTLHSRHNLLLTSVSVQSRGYSKLHGQRICNLERTSRWTVFGGLSSGHGRDRDPHQAWSASRSMQHVHWKWETSKRITRRSQGCRDCLGQRRRGAHHQGNVGQSVERTEWILQGERTRQEASATSRQTSTHQTSPTDSSTSKRSQSQGPGSTCIKLKRENGNVSFVK